MPHWLRVGRAATSLEARSTTTANFTIKIYADTCITDVCSVGFRVKKISLQICGVIYYKFIRLTKSVDDLLEIHCSTLETKLKLLALEIGTNPVTAEILNQLGKRIKISTKIENYFKKNANHIQSDYAQRMN